MGKVLTLEEVNDRWPSSNGAPIFKKWFNKFMDASGVDLNAFFGEDKDATVPTGGKQYVIGLSQANMALVKKTLPFPFSDKKYAIEEEVGAGTSPVFIEFVVPGTKKPVMKLKLERTGLAPRGGGKTSISPKTDVQERVTLKIFEELLSKSTPDYAKKGYEALAREQLSKIYPDILHPEVKDWGKHFELQYNDIRAVTKLPNNKFDTYEYDEFMKFISDLILSGPPTSKKWPLMGKVSQKDSWNPADIWLIDAGPKFNEAVEKMKTAGTVLELNAVLKSAFHSHLIVGISLKKSSGKPGGLHYELLNLESKLKQLPHVYFKNFKIETPFDGDKFEKTTWNIPIYNEKGQQIALMRTGSNTTGTGNNTYEMKKAGAATAMLGKVDKTLLLSRLQQDGIKRNKLPTHQEMRNLRPKNKGDVNYLHWQKVAQRISRSDLFVYPDADKIAEQLLIMGQQTPRDSKGIEKSESSTMQMLSFMDDLTKIGRKKIDELFEDFYYFAQKMGAVLGTEFGPFSKLY